MDPSASLVTEVAVHTVSGPADNHQDRECGATLKSVFPFHLIDELPHLMIDGRKPLSPLQARVDCANLFQCVLYGLQQLTKSQPGTLGWANDESPTMTRAGIPQIRRELQECPSQPQ